MYKRNQDLEIVKQEATIPDCQEWSHDLSCRGDDLLGVVCWPMTPGQRGVDEPVEETNGCLVDES